MSLTIRGTPDFRDGPLSPLFSMPRLSFLGVSRRKSPSSGQQWVLTYESPAANDPTTPSAAEVAYNLVPLDFSADLDATGPVYRLTVVTPDIPQGGTAGVQQFQYELLGNENQLDLREHPKALALGGSISASADILKKIDGVLNDVRDSSGNPVYAESDIPSGDATTLYHLLRQRNGNGVFQQPQFVFRYGRIASNRASIDVGYAGVKKIYTTEQMITETGPPTGILAAIADAFEATLPATVPPGYQHGWIKKTPTVTYMAGNKIQISGEYWLETWSTWIYDPA